MNDLVLLGSRDLGDGVGSLSSLSAHVGALGETTELYRMLVNVGLDRQTCGKKLTVSTIMPVIW